MSALWYQICFHPDWGNVYTMIKYVFTLYSKRFVHCVWWHTQGGIKYFTSWEPILSAKNFARNSGSQTRQRAFKIAVIWVLNMWFTHLYFLNYISIYFCLSQEISSCDKKFATVSWNSFLWQDISFCGKKFLLMPRNFSLWQDIPASDTKFLPVTRKHFL